MFLKMSWMFSLIQDMFTMVYFFASMHILRVFSVASTHGKLTGLRELKIILSSKLWSYFVFWYLETERCLKQSGFCLLQLTELFPSA